MRSLLLVATHLVACTILLLPSGPAAAQSAQATHQAQSARPERPAQAAAAPEVRSWTDPAIATVLLVDSLDTPNARAVVIRRPGDLPNNIILVTRATKPAELSQAVTALIGSRRAKGDRVDREMRAIVRALDGAKHKPSRDDARAKSDLHRLQLAPSFEIKGIGRGPALVIRMADASVPRRKADERGHQ